MVYLGKPVTTSVSSETIVCCECLYNNKYQSNSKHKAKFWCYRHPIVYLEHSRLGTFDHWFRVFLKTEGKHSLHVCGFCLKFQIIQTFEQKDTFQQSFLKWFTVTVPTNLLTLDVSVSVNLSLPYI